MTGKPVCKVNEFGTKRWTLDGKDHREDGPAIESPTGTKAWFFHGKLHRIDGPAIEYDNGEKVWFVLGAKFKTEIEFVNYKQLLLLGGEDEGEP